MTTTEVTEVPAEEDGDFEIVLLAVALIAAIVLGYRNKDKLKKMFSDAIGKLK
jgi:hypothetical protein